MPLQQHRVYRRQVYKTGSIFSVGPTTVRYLILVILGFFSLMFLTQVTRGAQVSADIRSETSQQAGQRQELNTLEIQSARLQSLENLNQTTTADGLVPIGNPDSITVPPTK